MGILPASFHVRLSIFAAVLAGCFALPAVASGAECTLPTPDADATLTGTEQVTKGNFKPGLNGKFIQIPFTVPAGTTGMRVRYCYDNTGPDGQTGSSFNSDNTTLDLGVYEPNAADPGNFTMNQRRGWSGSAVKMIGIGENGPTDSATYGTSDATRKAYTPGNTTRAYKPGPVPAGIWAVELGAGYIDAALAGGADWKVGVTTTTDTAWSDESFTPDPYTPYVANPAAGWYAGDLHVHGQNEPGNATMENSFDLGFDTRDLDFMTLVDHNNDVARQTELGKYDTLYPGKLIIPGTEMTTYDGHYNSQNSSEFTDFRMSDVYKFTGVIGDMTDVSEANLSLVRGPEDPSTRFAQIDAAGGWSQINHPSTGKDVPASCRGCAWTYSDARTDYSKVDAMEVGTGPIGLPSGDNPSGMNPFVSTAIEEYERALSTGAHIAAVTSSDDHKAKAVPGLADSTIGQGTTMVRADQLSQSGVTAGVKAGHTYARFFGPATPSIEMTGTGSTEQPGTAIVGDSLSSDEMKLSINVKNGGPSATPAGPYTLEILMDGIPVDSTTVVGDDFTYDDFSTSATGRYSFKLTRKPTTNTLIMAYSTPIWFTSVPLTCETDPSLCPKPSNKFAFKGVTLNKKKGTGRIKVKFPSVGKAVLTGPGLATVKATVKKKGQVIGLNLKPKSKLKKKLNKRGSAKVKIKVKFTPTGGKSLTKSKTVKLTKKKAKKRR